MQMMVYIQSDMDMDELNNMFAQGWRLVSMVAAAEGGCYLVIERTNNHR